MKLMCALMICTAALSGCGSTIQVEGIKDINVNINVASLLPYLQAYCERTNATPDEVEECVKFELGKLLSKI